MSKKLSGQDSGGEIKYTLKLVGPYKHNEKIPVQLKLSLGIKKDDQPDIGACGSIGLFSEHCDLRRLGSVQDNFKKEFGVPVYDEYEEEHLWDVPEKLAIEPGPADGEDQDAM